jgi:hypothetical protein
MSHRPVCVKCETDMRPKKNGVYVLDHAKVIGPYKLWSADLWVCPACEAEVVVGFGNSPMEHYQEEFGPLLERLGSEGKRVIVSREL